MARKQEIDFDLPKLDDLFTTQEERDEAKLKKIYDIPIDQIDDFPDHPFKVIDDEDMLSLTESIKEYGIITPAIVRKKEDGRYELIAGHRRKRACELAGLETLRSEVVDMERDEAIIFMVDSNLQRTKILPSEKAFSYKMKLDAMKRKQGERTDLTSAPMVQKLTSREVLAEKSGDSHEQVRRYIRLTELTSDLLQMVDEGKIAFRPAVELSYLSKEEQASLLMTMESEICTPSLAQAIKIKKFSQEGRLNDDVILSILSEEKPNQKEVYKLPKERLDKYFPRGTPPEKIEEIIFKALELYRKRERSREKER